MKKNALITLLPLSLLLLSCGEKGPSTSSYSYQIPERKKISLDSSKAKKVFEKGDAFSSSGLKVYLLSFSLEKGVWEEETEISGFLTSIKEGDILDQEGSYSVSISYLSYTPIEYTIRVYSTVGMKGNESFSYAKTTYEESGQTKPLNAATLGLNQENVAYLDPTSKKTKVLVVPYYFSDSKDVATEENLEMIRSTFFGSQEEAEAHSMPYSVASYYQASSQGQVDFDGYVLPWIPSKYGSSENISQGALSASEDLYSRYESEYAKQNHGILGAEAPAWSEFDGDKDGIVDLVWFVYSRPMEHVGTNQWWAYTVHEATPYAPSLSRPVIKTACWASFSFLNLSYDPHTFVHETGHAYGLSDYYCYNKSWSPMGGLAMMDNNIGDHDAYSKFALGWKAPLVVDEDALITLKPFCDGGDAVLLPSPNYNGTAFDEYLLLEFVGPYGLSKQDYLNGYGGLSGYKQPGLRILHVDSRVYSSSCLYPLESEPQKGRAYCYDNSKFGRSSSNTPSKCTTDYFEKENNPSGNDRSYSLVSTIPSFYDPDRNTLTTNMKLDDAALFREGSSFSLKEGYCEFMPSYSALWNKARKHVDGEVEIDSTCLVPYSVKILSQSEKEMKIIITKD